MTTREACVPSLFQLCYKPLLQLLGTFDRHLNEFVLDRNERQLSVQELVCRMRNYIQQLPRVLIDELAFRFFVYGFRDYPASLSAIFAHESQLSFVIFRPNEYYFSINNFIELCPNTFSNLRKLHLRGDVILSCDLQSVEHEFPNLDTIIFLDNVKLGKGAMQFVSSLPLKKLYLSQAKIDENELNTLCSTQSRAKRTLKKLKLQLFKRNLNHYLKLLQEIPTLEKLDTGKGNPIGNLLAQMVTEGIIRDKLNLTTLNFDENYNFDRIASYVIYIPRVKMITLPSICPKVTRISLPNQSFLPETLDSLQSYPAFNSLLIADDVRMVPIFEGVFNANFNLSKLVELSFRIGFSTYWMSSLFLFLRLCPNLKVLKFFMPRCSNIRFGGGFALELVERLSRSQIGYLYFENFMNLGCEMLRGFLNLPSLVVCEVKWFECDLDFLRDKRWEFSELEDLAKKRGVKFKYSVVPYYLDDRC